ncbi:hypothetical protein XA68_16634 [Ophiocordyceps unilateralis]|uniref:Uncharacterized protein n=1 Tax=Ophiocordyceps unilateralis TaxID=268505 RepID=A0A2A9PNW3_OPHUN|nr:hypothetical protein XA68_16634 [Ophiocordyceps unilateralis]
MWKEEDSVDGPVETVRTAPEKRGSGHIREIDRNSDGRHAAAEGKEIADGGIAALDIADLLFNDAGDDAVHDDERSETWASRCGVFVMQEKTGVLKIEGEGEEEFLALAGVVSNGEAAMRWL